MENTLAVAMTKICWPSNKTPEKEVISLKGHRNSGLPQSGTHSKWQIFLVSGFVLIVIKTFDTASVLVSVFYMKQDTFRDNLKNLDMVLWM